MSLNIEEYVEVVKLHGLNTDKAVDIDSTLNVEGAVTFQSTLVVTGGINASGGFAVDPRLVHTGGEPAIATTSGTNLDIVTTETYKAEVFIPSNMTITGIAVFNGTAVAGNLTVGLANSSGASVAASASTAASGTTAYQRIALSTPYAAKGPATYYVWVQGNNTGGDIRTHTVGNFTAEKSTGDTYGTYVTATPATTFTTGVGPIASLY
jgi:hypothetical protein